jgi:hypothetical protein
VISSIYRPEGIRIYFGGASDAAIEVAGTAKKNGQTNA